MFAAAPRPVRLLLATFVASLICAIASPAMAVAAEPRVYVREFQGPGAEEAREAVVRLVGDSFVLIPDRVFDKAADELDATTNTRANMVKVATEVGADVIVFGRTASKGKRKNKKTELRLTVREGKTGRLLARISVPWDSQAKGKKKLEPQLVEAVAKADPIADEAPVKASTKAKTKAKGGDREAAAPVPQASDDDEVFESESDAAPPAASDDEEIGGSEDDSPEVARSKPARHQRRGIVRLETSAVKRRLQFTYQGGLDTVPWGYTGAPAGLAGASGEYVVVAGLGVTGRYAQSLGMTARLEGNMAAVARLSQVEYGAGAFYRHGFGPLQLELSAGYNSMVFAIERREGVNIDVPNVAYTYVDPGVRFALSLGRFASLYVGGTYCHVLSTGDMQTAQNYGGGKVIGLEADGGLELNFGRHVVMSVGARYHRFAYIFNGSGAKATMRDADATLDVGGALDTYLGGYATLGYAF